VIHERDDVAQDADEERALRALDGAERLDVPIGFAENVMRSVRERAAGGTQLSGPARVLGDKNPEFWSPDRRREPSGGGSMSSRKLLLGIAAAAMVAIGYWVAKGFPPVGPGSDATVGAAKKYQSEQIAAKDVLLQNPEVQRVLQSDSFRRLVTNPETRAILTSKDFQKAMAAAEVQAFLALASRDAALGRALDGAVDAQAVSGLMGRLASDSAAAAAVDAALKDAAVEKAFDQAAAKATELNAFENVYYEICNEPYERGGLSSKWNDLMIQTIVETETVLPLRHLIAQGMAHGALNSADLDPRISVLNFHAAKPDAATLNYDLSRSIAFDETGGSDQSDRKYRSEGWEFMLAGQHSQAAAHRDGWRVSR
jgi:hypothetical protein